MVNSVITNVNSVHNPFAQFKTKQTDYRFATTKPYETDTFETEEVKERKLGKKIALSALGVGVGILFLMRGLPKNAYKTIDKWIEKLETKLYKQRKEGNMGKMEEEHGGFLIKLSCEERMGKPEELGYAIATVADERNGYLAGVDILCDGGSTRGMKEFKKKK